MRSPMKHAASTTTLLSAFVTFAMINFPRQASCRAISAAFTNVALRKPSSQPMGLRIRTKTTYNGIRCPRSSFPTTLRSSDDNDETLLDIPEIPDTLDSSYQNPNNQNDQVFSAMSGCGGIKVTVTTIRNLVNDMMLTHGLEEVPADALGRSMACGLMISNGMQDEQTLQLTLKGDGPLRGCVTITSGAGKTRGYVGTPALSGFSLSDAIGKGTVQIVKNHPDWPNPYNGITAIQNGDVDRDVGIYLAESEQRSCALAAATAVDGILCKAAGGYMVEKLPDCDPEVMDRVEVNLGKMVIKDGGDKIPTNLLMSGVTPLDIAGMVLEGLEMKPLGQLQPGMDCDCSEERLFRAIRLLPLEEVEIILEKQECVEARCHFCGRQYRMSPELVKERLMQAKGDPSKDSEIES